MNTSGIFDNRWMFLTMFFTYYISVSINTYYFTIFVYFSYLYSSIFRRSTCSSLWYQQVRHTLYFQRIMHISTLYSKAFQVGTHGCAQETSPWSG
ncbi:hypothetical protein CLU79DRAFT_251081 [Phycomyces nitens]|nr:hypothetical protein CLU79DRAFT_251081 [Phycomyces nitens]